MFGMQNPFGMGKGSPFGMPQQQFGQGFGQYGQGGYGQQGYGALFGGMFGTPQSQSQSRTPTYGPASPQTSSNPFGQSPFGSSQAARNPFADSNPFTSSQSLSGTTAPAATRDVTPTTTTATTTPPLPLGTIPPGGGANVPPINPFNNPNEAVRRALVAAGINPAYNFSPQVRALRAPGRGTDLVNSLIARTVLGGGRLEQFATDASQQDLINNAVQQALNGGRVFGLANPSGQNFVNTISQYTNPDVMAGSQGAQVLGQYLSDPERAAQFVGTGLYGGLSNDLARLYTLPIANATGTYQQALENGQGAQWQNLLQYLLQAPEFRNVVTP